LQKLRHGGLPPGQVLPKVPGHVTVDGATNAYFPYQRAVRFKV